LSAFDFDAYRTVSLYHIHQAMASVTISKYFEAIKPVFVTELSGNMNHETIITWERQI